MRAALPSAVALYLTACSAQAAPDCSVAAISALKRPVVPISAADIKAHGEGPPHCDVRGALTTTGEGADGSARFETKLPAQWNGQPNQKLLEIGTTAADARLTPAKQE
jgi:hypothetical protein